MVFFIHQLKKIQFYFSYRPCFKTNPSYILFVRKKLFELIKK